MTERAYDELDFAEAIPRPPIRAVGYPPPAGSGYSGRDGLVRSRKLDFGPLRVRVPIAAQLRMANEDGAESDAVFLTLPPGQVRLSVLAAPRRGRLWPDLAKEIATSQSGLGARVNFQWGEWGREMRIASDGELNWVIGVDGPRWMLLGRATWPADAPNVLIETMREMIRSSEVLRGDEPLPVRTALPLMHPDRVDEEIEDVEEAARNTPRTTPPVRLVERTESVAPVSPAERNTRPSTGGRPHRLTTAGRPPTESRPATEDARPVAARTDPASGSHSEPPHRRSRTGPLVGAAALALLGGAAVAYFVQSDTAPLVSSTDVALPAPPAPETAAALPETAAPLPETAAPLSEAPAPLPDSGPAPTVVTRSVGPIRPAAPVAGSAAPVGSASTSAGQRVPATATEDSVPASGARRESEKTATSGGDTQRRSRRGSEPGDRGSSQQRPSDDPGLVEELVDSVTHAVPGRHRRLVDA